MKSVVTHQTLPEGGRLLFSFVIALPRLWEVLRLVFAVAPELFGNQFLNGTKSVLVTF